MNPSPRPGRPSLTRGRVLALSAALGLLAVWVASGSLVLALLVLVLVGGIAGLATLGVSAGRPRPDPAEAPADLPTVTSGPAGPGGALRRALRGALARPWVRGDGLVRATVARLRGDGALVTTARGDRAAAPHVWVEWNVADVVEVGDRRPLDALLDELAVEYAEHVRTAGLPCPAAPSRVHLLARDDVPVGRVMVTAAYAPPADEAVATAVAPAPAVPLPVPAGPTGAGPVLVALVPGLPDVVLPAAREEVVAHLGRDPRAEVLVEHPAVSWRHLQLRSADGRSWTVTDLGSTNGTTVDGRPVVAATPLRPGAVLGVGSGPRYRLRGPAGPAPAVRTGRPPTARRATVVAAGTLLAGRPGG